MGIKRGTLEVGAIFRGSTIISKVYKGTTVIYELADGSYYELIEDVTIATATTSVQFSGFTATKEDSLVLVSDIIKTTAGSSSAKLYVNNNQTATNYWRQYVYGIDTGVGSARANDPTFLNVGGNSNSFTTTDIKLTNDGYYTYQSSTSWDYNTISNKLIDYVGSSTFTVTSITQLDIAASISNAIGIGSRFSLYRRTNL